MSESEMEATSSVYMCFPCYQEFNTLEEVLEHQLTCTAEAVEPPPSTPGLTSVSVPLLQAEVLGQHIVPSDDDVTQQIKSVVSGLLKKSEGNQAVASAKYSPQSDQPRILYQCGDCDEVFKSLELWQQHRKGLCFSLDAVPEEGYKQDFKSQETQDTQETQGTQEIHEIQETNQAHETRDTQDTQEIHRTQDIQGTQEPQDIEGTRETQQTQETQETQQIQQNQDTHETPEVPEQTAPSTTDTEESLPTRKRTPVKKLKSEPLLLCVDCGFSFSQVSELVAHRKTQHGLEEALHRCLVCGESFLNTTLFLYHRKQHRQKGEEKLTLEVEDGEMHLEVCEEEQVPKVIDQACSAVSMQPQSEEAMVPLNVCAEGDNAEEQETTIQTHSPTSAQLGRNEEEKAELMEEVVETSSVAVTPTLFLCTQCGESFNKKDGLATHRKQKHGLQEALHHCSQCGQEFMNTTQYLYHRRMHREDPAARAEAALPEESWQQGQKRLLSPSTSSIELDSPRPKRGRPAINITSASALKKMDREGGIKEEVEYTAVSDQDGANFPPPAKLLQDWARTPLPHVCPYCGKTFTRRVFLRTHVFSHTKEKLFTCKVCLKSFTNSQSLLRHTLIHTGAKPFYCDICCKNFSQAATLKRHQRMHESTQPRRKRGRKPVCELDSDGGAALFSCPNCSSRFITEEQLKTHVLLHTSHPFHCPECGLTFKRRKELDLHSLTHQDKEPVSCPHCDAQFLNQSVLTIHLERCLRSQEERNAGRGRGQGRGRCTGQIECDLCGHRCMTQEGLDLHRLSHTGQTPLKCPVLPCRRRFASHAALEKHVLAHVEGKGSARSRSQPRFRCEICLKEFAYTSTFNVHMRTHTDERPFECATCGKRFRQLPHLQDHERIHSGLRPFSCWVCGRSFSVAARLTEHARTHSGEKPYPCAHCPAAFRSRSNLDKHARQHGGIVAAAATGDEQADEVTQRVLEGAKLLSSLGLPPEDEAGVSVVQTIYVLQSSDGTTETVMIPSDQMAAFEESSQVVILPSSVLEAQSFTVPTISMVEGSLGAHDTIEYVVEETIAN